MTKVAVVTGATGGIGRAVCDHLHDEGWRVVGLDLTADPQDASCRVVDVRDREALSAVLDDLPQVDGVVSNAGVMSRMPLAQTSASEWETMLATNLSATFHLISLLHERLAENHGAIVAVSSVHAVATTANAGAYAATKAGLLGLVRGAAVELGPMGVRVNAVLPGATDTAMLNRNAPGFETLVSRTPLRRIAQPQEVAEAVAFLLDETCSGFITGQQFVIDGGVLAQLSTED